MAKSNGHNWVVNPPQNFKKIPANHSVIEDETLVGQKIYCSMRKRREKFTIKKIFKDNKDILCVEVVDQDGAAAYTFPADTCKLEKPRYKFRRKRKRKSKKKLE